MGDVILFVVLIGMFALGYFFLARMGSFLDKSFRGQEKAEGDRYGQKGETCVEYDYTQEAYPELELLKDKKKTPRARSPFGSPQKRLT